MTQKTRKVMEINDNGIKYVVIRHFETFLNPYKVYRVYWNDGWHRINVAEYADMNSCLCYLLKAIKGHE